MGASSHAYHKDQTLVDQKGRSCLRPLLTNAPLLNENLVTVPML